MNPAMASIIEEDEVALSAEIKTLRQRVSDLEDATDAKTRSARAFLDQLAKHKSSKQAMLRYRRLGGGVR